MWVWVWFVGVHECKLGCESDGVCVCAERVRGEREEV